VFRKIGKLISDLFLPLRMPVVEIKWWKGRTKEQKAKVIAEVTEIFTRQGVPADQVWVVIQDVEKSDWGIGGKPSG